MCWTTGYCWANGLRKQWRWPVKAPPPRENTAENSYERLVLFRLRLRERLRLPPDRLRLEPTRLRLRLLPVARRPPVDFLRRVAAALRALRERLAFDRDAAARPPFLPPFLEELRFVFFPRPDPLFFPPPVSLFTVAQARRSASRRETPRFSYPSSICSAWRFCLLVYEDLSPRGIIVTSSWCAAMPIAR